MDTVSAGRRKREIVERTPFLKKVGLFGGLTDREISTVLSTAKERRFGAGETIIEEGYQGGAGFYVLLEGRAVASRAGKKLHEFAPGDYFGEMALLLENTPRTASIVTLEPTTCLVITAWDLKSLIDLHPAIAVKMTSELARRLSRTDGALSG